MNNLTNQLIDVFGLISKEKIEALARIFSVFTKQAGENIFLQGDDPSAIYIVSDGRLKITRISHGGEESILCIREAGDIFCPVPILDNGTQLGTATAITDVEFLRADKHDFNRISQDSPEIVNCIQGDCLNEVRRLLRRLESFAYHSVRERLAFLIYEEVKKIDSLNSNIYEIHLKQKDLAGLVGASRESVTRELAKFQKQGILSVQRGKLLIQDIEKLKILAEIE